MLVEIERELCDFGLWLGEAGEPAFYLVDFKKEVLPFFMLAFQCWVDAGASLGYPVAHSRFWYPEMPGDFLLVHVGFNHGRGVWVRLVMRLAK